MTNNRTDSQNIQSQNTQPKNNQSQSTQPPTQAVNSNNLAVNKTPETSSKAAEPQMKKVDIVIAGTTYPIYCPIHEEEELRSAVDYINNIAVNIRKGSPNLGQENLLVLSCLNLYEKIDAHKKIDNSQRQQSKQTEALLSKVIKDAQSIL